MVHAIMVHAPDPRDSPAVGVVHGAVRRHRQPAGGVAAAVACCCARPSVVSSLGEAFPQMILL